MRGDDLGRRDRQCHRSPRLDRPADLAAGPDRDSAGRRRCPTRSIGTCGSASPRPRPSRPAARLPEQFGGYFYQPFNWRGFYDFGCGALGDMACHILGAPNMALQLGAPTSVECIKKEGASSFMFPKKSIIRFDFPARGSCRRSRSSGTTATKQPVRSRACRRASFWAICAGRGGGRPSGARFTRCSGSRRPQDSAAGRQCAAGCGWRRAAGTNRTAASSSATRACITTGPTARTPACCPRRR